MLKLVEAINFQTSIDNELLKGFWTILMRISTFLETI